MSFWKPPELPPAEKMPTRRRAESRGHGKRVLAGVAGVAFGLASLLGLLRALQDTSGGGRSPFMSLALLLPAVILVRYALTGVIKK